APAAAAPAAPAEPGRRGGGGGGGGEWWRRQLPSRTRQRQPRGRRACWRQARDALLDAGLDRAPLPDVCETFSQPMARGLVVVRGAVEARAGWVSQLSSVHRTGDATLERAPGGGATLTASLGLANLSAGYDACEVSDPTSAPQHTRNYSYALKRFFLFYKTTNFYNVYYTHLEVYVLKNTSVAWVIRKVHNLEIVS
ncbi:Uncharacterized protein GBIM_04745, partial [Gryllus bimaculatus]